MSHFSENARTLTITQIPVQNREVLLSETRHFTDVCVLRLPSCAPSEYRQQLEGVSDLLRDVSSSLEPDAALVILGEIIDLVHVHAVLAHLMQYQLWISIKRNPLHILADSRSLPQHHFGALVYTRYKSSLRHTKTRIEYTYCPTCNKTTKDYGGKKHTYHQYGTLLSDVWRDIECGLDSDLTPVIDRFADLFGIEPYRELRVLDCRPLGLKRIPDTPVLSISSTSAAPQEASNNLNSSLLLGDCLRELRKLPDNSVDFAFADPPYNLKKKYSDYADDLTITEYFAWCDEWITELARVLRPGRTCALLNIPLWAIRHFLHMESVLHFQNWIAWDALSFPVRMIMPAHYAILCFSKGTPRVLPGLANEDEEQHELGTERFLRPMAEGYCLRSECVTTRKLMQLNDRGPLTDLWWDIHRLKHNSRRVDHPCQLPSQLMYRLISLFTKPGEVVLDCFNGAGTTTLAAHQLGRKYIGIEMAEVYHNLAKTRHEEILLGMDPFRKVDRPLTAKNSPVPRLLKQKYKIPKKVLQLEVKRVAGELGHIPTHDELSEYGKYPIQYYDDYFTSWGEVCAAARTTGMSENRISLDSKLVDESVGKQLRLFERKVSIVE